MDTVFKVASTSDTEIIIEMMREFYSCEQLDFIETSARNALAQLFRNKNYGTVHLIYTDNKTAGYIIITYCFSLEFHGRFALIDEIFLLEDFRNKGIGKLILFFIEELCRKMDITVIRLEVEKHNHRAFALYEKNGFIAHDRNLLSKWLK